MVNKKKAETSLATQSDRFPALASGQRITTMLKEGLAGETLSIADLDRIKIPTGGGTAWSYSQKGEDIVGKTIEGVIVHHQMTRVYWAAPYGSGAELSPPDCFSADAITGKGDPGGDCSVCPMAEWGSKNGQRGQACQARRLLFILLEGELLPRIISVSPGSLTVAKKYILSLVREGLTHTRVVTSIGLVKTKNAGGIDYSQLTFKMAGVLTAEVASRARVYGDQLRVVMQRVSGDDMVTQNTDEQIVEERL